jgi:hypothetical protein
MINNVFYLLCPHEIINLNEYKYTIVLGLYVNFSFLNMNYIDHYGKILIISIE